MCSNLDHTNVAVFAVVFGLVGVKYIGTSCKPKTAVNNAHIYLAATRLTQTLATWIDFQLTLTQVALFIANYEVLCLYTSKLNFGFCSR